MADGGSSMTFTGLSQTHHGVQVKQLEQQLLRDPAMWMMEVDGCLTGA